MIGIKIQPNNNKINHVKLGPIKAAYYSIKEIVFVSQKAIEMLWGYIQKIWGKGYGDLRQLGGPIKIAQVSGDVAKMGLLPFIMIISYISISLGLFNLFPIPLLDGGHIALNTAEAIRGKEFNKKTLDYTFRIGMTVIATLIVFTVFNDLSNFLTRFFNNSSLAASTPSSWSSSSAPLAPELPLSCPGITSANGSSSAPLAPLALCSPQSVNT